MKGNDNRSARRLKKILEAWSKVAPEAILDGMTLDQFKTATSEPEAVRQRISSVQRELDALRQERLMAEPRLREKIADLVNAVKASKEFGENSPLYRAFGYVPKNARSSGLHRKSVPKPAEDADAV